MGPVHQLLHALGDADGHHLDGVVPEVDGLVGGVVAEEYGPSEVVQLQLWQLHGAVGEDANGVCATAVSLTSMNY